MANTYNKYQLKRTSVSGRTPNTTNSSNSSFLDTAELALNLTDKKMFSSNGTVLFEVGANLSSLNVTGNANIVTLAVSNSIVVPSINVATLATGNVTVNGYANISGTLAAGNTTITGTVNVSSNSWFGNTLFIDAANNKVGINVQSPEYDFHVVSERDPGGIIFDTYGAAAPNIKMRRARGTKAAPTPTLINDGILTITAHGYGNSGFSGTSKAAITMFAAETWTDTAQGTYMVFGTTNTASTTRANRVYISANGNVGIGANFSTPTSLLHVNGTLTAGNTTIIGLANVTTLNSGNVAVTGVANVTGNVSVTDTIFGKDVTLTGNLTVSGTTTYINTVTLNVGDNIVTLNADVPNTTAPTENAGIEINRGSSANVQFIWDETNDRWTTNTQPMYVGGTLAAGNTTVTGFVNVSSYGTFGGAVNAASINIGPNVNISTSLLSIGNSTVNTQISAGNVFLNGSLLTVGNTSINVAIANGTANLSSSLGVGSNVSLSTLALVIGNTTVNTTVNSSLITSRTVGGPNTGIMLNGMNMFAFSNSGGNEGNPTFRTSVANNQTVLRVLPNGIVNVATQTQFEFFAVDYFSNTTNWHNLRILAQTDRFVIDTARGANTDPARPIVFDIGGTGQSNATNANYPAVLVLSANGKVGISNATPDATLTVTGTSNVSGNVAIGGTLTVTGNNATGNTTITGSANISSTLNVVGAATVNGAFTVNNTAALGNTTITGFVNVSSYGTFGGTVNATALNIGANVSLSTTSLFVGNATVNSTMTSTNYVFGGGDTQGIGFYSSFANYSIAMKSQAASQAGRLDATSDYNMYFQMNGGTNRGFVFRGNGNASNGAVAQIDSTGNFYTLGSLYLGNTATNTTISTSLISIGNSTVNTQISAGNVFLNGSLLTVGNTTVNTSISNGTANVSTLLNVGANVNLSTTQLNVGNTTVNAVLTSASLAITNAVSVTTNGHEFVMPAATGQFKISRDNLGSGQGLTIQSTSSGNFLNFNSTTINAKPTAIDVPTSNTTADIYLDLRVAGVSKVKANTTIVTITGAANVTGAFAVNNTAALGNTTVTGRLGVANSTPSQTFQVDGTSWFKPNNDGTLADVMYLGRFSDSDQPAYIVKTNDATDDLLMIKSNRYNGYFNWKRNSANGEVYVSELMGVSGSQTYFRLYHTETDNTIKVQLATGGDSYINTAANVGIGTSTPNAKLQVVGTVNISSTAIIGGALTVSNTAALGNTTITGFANASSLNVVGAATVNGAFIVNNTASVGNTTITGFANVSSTLNVVGNATVNGAFTVNNTAAFGNTTITGTLSSGNTTHTGDLTVTGNTTANNIRAQGSVQIDGNLTVSGNTITIGVTNLAVSDNIIYLNEPETATITSATSNATSFIYTANNGFNVGQVVTVAGITPSGYNVTSNTITFANATTFAVANTVAGPGAYVSGGTATARVDTNPDFGFAANYNDGTYRHAGFFRDATDGVFKVFDQYLPEPTGAFIDTANASFRIADFQANNTTLSGNTYLGGVSGSEGLRVATQAGANRPIEIRGGVAGSLGARFGVSNEALDYYTSGGYAHFFATNGPRSAIQFAINNTASAVNYISATGNVTGSSPYFLAAGSDTNIGVVHATKGTGAFSVWTNGGTAQQFNVTHTASAINYVELTGAQISNAPMIGSRGSDTNINFAYSSKGTGGHDFYTAGTSFTRQFNVTHTASAVNYVQVTGAATGSSPTISAQGSDAVVSFAIRTKGTGSNITPQFDGSVYFQNLSSQNQFRVFNTASAVNYLQTGGSTAGSGLAIQAAGSDTNIDLNLTTKGTGSHKFNTGTGEMVRIADSSGTGYVQLSGGTTPYVVAQGSTNASLSLGSNGTGTVWLRTNGGGTTQAAVVHTASAVNYIQVSGAATGGAPYVLANGSDTDVPLVLSSKGAASILFKTAGTTPTQFAVAHTASADRYLQITGGLAGTSSPSIGTAGGSTTFNIYSSGGSSIDFWTNGVGVNRQLSVAHTASAVNYVQVTGAATGANPTISAQGSDTNVNIFLSGKGTGYPTLNTLTSVGGTATNAQTLADIRGLAGNVEQLRASLVRHTTGADWTGVGYRFGQVVDVTAMSYIEFNPVGQSQGLAVNVAGNSPFQVKTSGGEQFRVADTSSAVNYVQVTGAATGSGPIVSAQGSDTDVRLNLTSKGTNSIDMLTNSAGTRQFRFSHTASAVNYLQATGSVTGSAPTLSAQGTDTDIGVVVNSKGAGSVNTQVNSVTKLSVSNTTLNVTGNTYLFLGSFNGEGGELVFANTTGGTGPIIDVDGGNDWRWNTYNNTSNIKFNTGASSTTKLQISANGNVGIGNTAPIDLLSVNGTTQITNSTASVFLAAANGNIGIGYNSPNFKLRVAGTIVGDANDNYFGTISGDYVDIGNLGATGSVYFDARGASSNVNVQIRAKGSADHIFTVAGGATEIVRFKPSGNVGIGNSAPTDKLRVEGTLSHLGLVPSTGTGIDQIFTATPSITLNTNWQSTGVTSTNLANGSYMVQLFANDIAAGGTANNEYYTGMMSWYSADTNSTVLDEIPLHRAGVSGSNNSIFLATQRTATANTSDLLLMISSAANNSSASTYTIKFRRMI